MQTPISRTFADLKARGRMAFMPFITAGDPDLSGTQRLIGELVARVVRRDRKSTRLNSSHSH